jgi:nucleotide-binding universal stress UspA family protein
MHLFRTILVAADFSRSSCEAFRAACSLAQESMGRLTILHVVDEPPFFGNTGQQEYGSSAYRSNHEAIKGRLCEVYSCAGEINAEYYITYGNAAGEILLLAEAVHCDLIVMGTHGRSGLDRLLVGSAAEVVMKRARCPVISVWLPPLVSAESQSQNEAAAAPRGSANRELDRST